MRGPACNTFAGPGPIVKLSTIDRSQTNRTDAIYLIISINLSTDVLGRRRGRVYGRAVVFGSPASIALNTILPERTLSCIFVIADAVNDVSAGKANGFR